MDEEAFDTLVSWLPYDDAIEISVNMSLTSYEQMTNTTNGSIHYRAWPEGRQYRHRNGIEGLLLKNEPLTTSD